MLGLVCPLLLANPEDRFSHIPLIEPEFILIICLYEAYLCHLFDNNLVFHFHFQYILQKLLDMLQIFSNLTARMLGRKIPYPQLSIIYYRKVWEMSQKVCSYIACKYIAISGICITVCTNLIQITFWVVLIAYRNRHLI